MDIFLLHAIVKELSPLLLGRRPGKVWQIGQTDLMVEMNLRQGRTTRWLRISTDPLRLGLYVTARGPRSYSLPPRADTPFVELWQKHLDGMRLTEIEPLGYDRIVKFHFVSLSFKIAPLSS
ncbi:MAG: NFACT family protein, partial [Blastocatellia bacterium]